jgi:integrase
LEIIKTESDPYSMFAYAIRSSLTRDYYLRRLRRFFDFLGLNTQGTIDKRYNLFAEMGKANPSWVFSGVIQFLQFQKERVEKGEVSGATLKNFVKPIKLFCEMSDIPVPWKKIARGLQKIRRFADHRAPTLEEIRKIVEYPDRRIKAVVFTMASSGIRLGAWEYLRGGHIKPIEREGKIVAAKMSVYAGDDEEYLAFITPESYFELKKWMMYRSESGEEITEKSWIMRHLWNTKQGHMRGLVTAPKRLKSAGVKRLMEDALWTQSLRRKLDFGNRRHEFQADHGLRKWFKTRCEISGMKPVNIEILMNHSVGISDSYYRAIETDLLNDYLNATILEENKLRAENQKAKEFCDSLQREREELYLLRKELLPLFELKNTLVKEGVLKEF